jgi:hypothetical protein
MYKILKALLLTLAMVLLASTLAVAIVYHPYFMLSCGVLAFLVCAVVIAFFMIYSLI